MFIVTEYAALTSTMDYGTEAKMLKMPDHLLY